MMLSKERIHYLLEAFIAKRATSLEEQELMEWIYDAKDDIEFKSYIEKLWNSHDPAANAGNVDWDKMFNSIIQKDVYSIAPEPKNKAVGFPWISAAAVIILVLFATGIYLLSNQDTPGLPVAENKEQQPLKDVAPPSANKATLTLGNGEIIILDNAATGSLAEQGIINAALSNNDDLIYTSIAATELEYHTLQIPKGSKPMQLQLADGSEVWLNASSSITFPNVFSGSERKVMLTGEAYFEVKQNIDKPFIVSKGEMQVQVLGTQFNIDSYEDEGDIKVTLLEGSVKVGNGKKEAILRPGQQARLTGATLKIINDVNTDEVIAWKNGYFNFNNTSIQTIMRQIERWYDVKVVFDGPITQHFNGKIQRQVNVSRVLSMLEKTGGIQFNIEGNTVVVKKS